MKSLHELSVAEIGRSLRGGRLTSLALTQAQLERIHALDPALHLFFDVTAGRALDDARRADGELQRGIDRGPLHGVPYGLKDVFATQGIATTCNSKLRLGHHLPDEDAAVEARLRAGGAVLLGKLSTSEFACGGPSSDLPFPVSRNPWNPEHYTGGSSSGSAGAVAAGLMRMAIGSDTGGSIRVPAAYCGVVGLKPTFGLVSRRGLFPLSHSLDHCGPLAFNVEDAALTMNVIAGYDPRDPASVERPPQDYGAKLGRNLRGLRLGYARRLLVETAGVLPDAITEMDRTADALRRLGAAVEEIALPDFELFRAASRVIITAEAFAVHEDDLRQRPLDFGQLTYQRLIAGAAISAADLIDAFKLRRELIVGVEAVLQRCDATFTSTGLGQAPRLDAFSITAPPPMVGAPTVVASVTGHPALSLPTGLSSDDLPLAVQIIGRAFDEATIFQIGAALEAELDFARLRPPIAG